jgi:glycosyltransferase involved in cell wall biosynthesis
MSIVTPSYNQGEFLEEAIRSVLLQQYPDLEYVVMDGGSDDETVRILEKYDDWIDHWVSEDDEGQSHAINKGFEAVSGDLFTWMNSDDYYLPGALRAFAEAATSSPEAAVWAGACHEVDIEGTIDRTLPPSGLDSDNLRKAFGDWWFGGFFHQPASCIRAEAFREVGGLTQHLYYAMDVDLWVRLADVGPFVPIDEPLACARMYEGIKTWENRAAREAEMIAVNVYGRQLDVAEKRLDRYTDEVLRDEVKTMGYLKLTKLVLRRVAQTLRSVVRGLRPWSGT